MSSVQSIRRAFDVLGALATGPLGVTEVADRAGLPEVHGGPAARRRSSAKVPSSRCRATRSYRLGPRLATLAAGLTPARSLAAVAHPALTELAAAAGEAAGLSVPDGESRPLHRPGRHAQPGVGPRLDRQPGAAPRRLVGAGAARVPPAGGHRALPGAAAGAVHARDTLIDPDALRERLRAVRHDGYAWVLEEFDEGINSVAAPIADASARWSPRSTSTGRRTASRSGARATRSPSGSSGPPPGSPRASGIPSRAPRRVVAARDARGSPSMGLPVARSPSCSATSRGRPGSPASSAPSPGRRSSASTTASSTTAVAAAGGIVVKHEGDGTFAVFAGRAPRVGGRRDRAEPRGREPRRSTTAAPVRVRIGLHSGDGTSTEHGSITSASTSITRPAVARPANGGQIVLSDTAARRLGGPAAGGHRARSTRASTGSRTSTSHGGSTGSSSPGVADDDRPLRTADLPTNLPEPVTTFVGRDATSRSPLAALDGVASSP